MKNLKNLIYKFFIVSSLILPAIQANTMILIEETPHHDTRCYDPIFRDYHPNICYHYDSYYGFWVGADWYRNHHHHYRALSIHHYAPFHGEVHRHHHGRHHHDD